MELQIKILEEIIFALKEGMEYEEPFGREVCHIAIDKRELQALENLIKGYRELEYKYNKALTDLSIECKRTNEENYRCSLFAVENNDLKEKLADSIPKSKVKEKIEEYEKMKKATYKDLTHYGDLRRDTVLEVLQVLQELMEDK